MNAHMHIKHNAYTSKIKKTTKINALINLLNIKNHS